MTKLYPRDDVTLSVDIFFTLNFFWIHFNVPFKIISLIETSKSVGGRNGSTPGKPPDTSASRTCLAHMWPVRGSNLHCTPYTAVR